MPVNLQTNKVPEEQSPVQPKASSTVLDKVINAIRELGKLLFDLYETLKQANKPIQKATVMQKEGNKDKSDAEDCCEICLICCACCAAVAEASDNNRNNVTVYARPGTNVTVRTRY